MKKIVSLVLAMLFVSSISVMSYAKSHFITPGARALGYGSAFSPIADDLTAIYYNPAGLAYQKDTQIMASVFYINYNATADKEYDFTGGYGLVTSKDYNTSAVVPFFGFSTKFYGDTTIAAAVYAIGGGGGKVEDLQDGCKIEGQQSFMVYNISLAKQLTDKFAIGLGFDAIEMSDKLVTKIPLAGVDVDYNRSAFGFQGNLGLMYKPIEKLSTAFVLRTGTYIGLPTEYASSNSSFVNGYTYPLTAEIGAAYDVIDPVTVSLAVAYNKYSWTSVAYKDTFQIKVGSEYRATEKLSLHLGFFTDPNIMDDDYRATYNLINLDMYDMNYLSLGAEYKFTDALKLGLTLTHSFTIPVTYADTTYKYEANLGRFDISYKF